VPLILLSCLAAARGAAQSTDEVRREVRRLQRVQQSLEHVLDTTPLPARPAGTSGPALDTLRRGPITAVATPAARALANETLESIWPTVRRTYGRAVERMKNLPIDVQVIDVDGGTFAPHRGALQASLHGRAGPDVAAFDLLNAISAAMFFDLDSRMQAWLRVPLVPPLQPVRYEAIHVELVTSPWHRVQDCHRGGNRGCLSALGLTSGTDPAGEWYDEQDRRRLAIQLAGSDPGDSLMVLCRQGSDRACQLALDRVPRRALRTPFSDGARLSLLQLAIRRSGDSGWERLRADTLSPIAARVAAVAQETPEALVADWRDRILHARPTPITLTERTAWSGVSWCLIFLVLAMRSSRWR